jgi:hypothetical protein
LEDVVGRLVGKVGGGRSRATSGEEAGARVGSALDELAKSFREAYGPVDCD